MKKNLVLFGAVAFVLAVSSCKSSESAYKKAYEKAKAQDESKFDNSNYNSPTITPMVEQPMNDAQVVDNYDNVSVRQESVTMVDGSTISAFNVVVGSFSVKANAEGLKETLKNAGYDAKLAYNADRKMYRVIATSFDSKDEAARSRNQLKSIYPDAWLLYKN